MGLKRFKLKVAIIVNRVDRNSGGLFYSVSNLAKSLVSNGVEVEVFTQINCDFKEDITQWSGVKINFISSSGFRGFRFSFGFVNAVRAFNPDIVHMHGLWLGESIVIYFLRMLGFRTVISPRGMLDIWALNNSKFRKLLFSFLFERSNISNATFVHALNSSEYDSIKLFAPTARIEIIPNAIELPDDRRSANIATAISHDRHTPPCISKPRILLFLGRLDKKKGLEQLLDVWEKLCSCGSVVNGWHLQISGWGDPIYVQFLRSRIHECSHFSGTVSITGALYGESKYQALASATAFILPSFSEGLPMAVLEAWSFSLPCLISRKCNLPEALNAGVALEVDPVDQVQFFNALRDFMMFDDQALNYFADMSFEYVSANYELNAISRKMIDCYASCS